jgi:Flp pilus assembly protein TadD
MPRQLTPAQDVRRRRRKAPAKAVAAPRQASGWLVRLLPWLALALALLIFAGTLDYPFVYDDLLLPRNPTLAWRFVAEYFVHNIWNRPDRDVVSNYYRPLNQIWMMVNHELFGTAPGGYHATAIALHALVTFLVFLLAARTLKDRVAAGFAALLFAVHPLHVESVAWISAANEPEYALFFLAAMLCYLRWRESAGVRLTTYDLRVGRKGTASLERRDGNLDMADGKPDIGDRKSQIVNRKWFFLSLACYALALLSKETAVMLCAMIFFYEWRLQAAGHRPHAASHEPQAASSAPRATRHAPHATSSEQERGDGSLKPEAGSLEPGAGNWKLVAGRLGACCLVVLPYVAVTAVYLAARAHALQGLAPGAFNQVSRASVVLSFPEAFFFYLRKMLWPLPMSILYSLGFVTHPGLANFAWPLAASLALLAGLWYWSRRSPAAGAASAWLLLPLAPPVLAIWRFPSFDLVHDRCLYLPSAGLVILMALAVRRLNLSAVGGRRGAFAALRRFGGREVAGIPAAQLLCVLLLVCLLGGLTLQQAPQWSSNLALFQHAVDVAPRNPEALAELMTAIGPNDVPYAMRLAERALAEDPRNLRALVGAGLLHGRLHDTEGQIALLEQARRLYPGDANTRFLLAVCYLGKRQMPEAEAEARAAILSAPQTPDQHSLLGEILFQEQRLAEARSEFQAELQIQPGSAYVAQRLAAIEALPGGR